MNRGFRPTANELTNSFHFPRAPFSSGISIGRPVFLGDTGNVFDSYLGHDGPADIGRDVSEVRTIHPGRGVSEAPVGWVPVALLVFYFRRVPLEAPNKTTIKMNWFVRE